MSDDDVLDFIVIEAMTTKIGVMRRAEEKKEKSRRRRAAHKKLRGLKPGDPLPEGFGD